MPAKSPQISINAHKLLRSLGEQIRARRSLLGISAIATAESVGMSRVTLYRIERGEPSVTMGAYLSVIEALGLTFELVDSGSSKRKRPDGFSESKAIPRKIRIADYKQLKRLAWQVADAQEISAKEALDIYERNWRHIDFNKITLRERKLIKALLRAFGKERPLV